jgi:rsbT co-antagonist protein RsbR
MTSDTLSHNEAGDEMAQLRQRLAELEQENAQLRLDIANLKQTGSAEAPANDELRIFRTLADNAPDAIGIAAPDGIITYANPAFRAMFGYGDAMMGMLNTSLFSQADQSERIPALLEAVVREGAWTGTLTGERRDGSTFPTQISPFAIRDSDGQILAIPCILRDMSEIQRSAAERATLQEQIIATQQAAIHELSTPLLPLANKVLALPLIGTIDSTRAQQVIESLLQGVAIHQAAIAIIDITGVHVVDTQVANALVHAAQAVKLLGAQVVLTGIRPEVAQTLVSLSANLSDLVTRGTLQDGIAYAMRQ